MTADFHLGPPKNPARALKKSHIVSRELVINNT